MLSVRRLKDPVPEQITLVRPLLHLAPDFRALAQEFLAEGDERYREAAQNVPAFLQACEDHADGRNLPADWVPQNTFWLVRGGTTILGCSRVRHGLTPFLAAEGGHVGYDVRPSERGKGYGTVLLRLTLPGARKVGLTNVLITADEDNVASWRVIERNGGRREEGAFLRKAGPFRRYWVAT
jgi:predicted acetyltransferase